MIPSRREVVSESLSLRSFERMRGLTSIKFMDSVKKEGGSIRRDLLDEGFDLDDVEDFILYIARKALGVSHRVTPSIRRMDGLADMKSVKELSRVSVLINDEMVEEGFDDPDDGPSEVAEFIKRIALWSGVSESNSVNEGFWRADIDVLADHSPKDLRRKLDTVLSEVERGDDLDMRALDSLITSLQAIKKAARQFSTRGEAEEAGFVSEGFTKSAHDDDMVDQGLNF